MSTGTTLDSIHSKMQEVSARCLAFLELQPKLTDHIVRADSMLEGLAHTTTAATATQSALHQQQQQQQQRTHAMLSSIEAKLEHIEQS